MPAFINGIHIYIRHIFSYSDGNSYTGSTVNIFHIRMILFLDIYRYIAAINWFDSYHDAYSLQSPFFQYQNTGQRQ